MSKDEDFEATKVCATTELSPRLKELQQKIRDESYLSNAIDRIAVIISRQLVGNHAITDRSAEMTF